MARLSYIKSNHVIWRNRPRRHFSLQLKGPDLNSAYSVIAAFIVKILCCEMGPALTTVHHLTLFQGCRVNQ